MSPFSDANPTLQNQSLVQFASGSVELVTYSNTVNTSLIGTRIIIAKRALESEASLGSTITYELLLTNIGNVTGSITLIDHLPIGTSFVANSVILNGNPIPGENPDTGIGIGYLAPQASSRILFQLIVTSLPSSLEITNTAQADSTFQTSEGRTITYTTYSNTVRIPVNPIAVSVSHGASTSQTFIGDIISFELTISNEGNLSLNDVIAYVTIPAGFLFITGSVTINGIITTGADPRWGISLGTLRAHTTTIITYQTQTTSDAAPVSISQGIVRYVVSGTSDLIKSNEVSITLIDPDINLEKAVNRLQAVPGDILSYMIHITNDQSIAVDAILEDVLPQDLIFVKDSLKLDGVPQPGTLLEDGLNLGTLIGQSKHLVTFDAVIPLHSSNHNKLTNVAKVRYTFRLTDGRIISSTSISNEVSTLVMTPIIQLTAKVAPRIVDSGDKITITAYLKNSGNRSADVTFSSLFPSNVHLLPASFRVNGQRLNASAYDGNRSWLIGIINPEDEIQIVYSAIVTDSEATEEIIGFVRADFTYEVDDRSFAGDTTSSALVVKVIGDDE